MKKIISTVLVSVLGITTEMVKADFTFGEPVNLGPTVNSEQWEYSHCVSGDGLELYYIFGESWDPPDWDISVSTRTTVEDDWGSPTNLGPVVNSPDDELAPCISADGLELYFQSNRPGGAGLDDIWVSRRATSHDPWGEPENLGPPVNTETWDYNPCLSSDGLQLYFAYGREPQLAVTKRDTKDSPWGEAVNLGPVVNNWACQDTPWISSDSLLLMFTDFWARSPRPDGFGGTDIWFSRRATKESEWGEPVNLGPVINTLADEDFPMISANGTTLYFNSNRVGSFGMHDLWQAPIIPVVDLNGDGIVDAEDMCIMVDHWGTDNKLYDIGPMPWGDGTVDVQDLIVLAEHLFEDYRLVAQWALDEDAANIAYDSAGENDATLQGGPIWQPYGGKVGGALQFNGVDDYVSTPFILNPNKGSFSVSAWIKGGGPGQVIISQSDLGRDQGNTWLLADASYGRLMTRLMHPPFPPLVSESVITDDQWHHVGLIFDIITLHRYLYVDGIEVAKDSDYVAGVGSDGGLYIGVDKTLDAASFFSGLIDDVRIYNNVLNAEDIAALSQ